MDSIKVVSDMPVSDNMVNICKHKFHLVDDSGSTMRFDSRLYIAYIKDSRIFEGDYVNRRGLGLRGAPQRLRDIQKDVVSHQCIFIGTRLTYMYYHTLFDPSLTEFLKTKSLKETGRMLQSGFTGAIGFMEGHLRGFVDHFGYDPEKGRYVNFTDGVDSNLIFKDIRRFRIDNYDHIAMIENALNRKYGHGTWNQKKQK